MALAAEAVDPRLSDMHDRAQRLIDSGLDLDKYLEMQSTLGGWGEQERGQFSSVYARAQKAREAMADAAKAFAKSRNPETYIEMRRFFGPTMEGGGWDQEKEDFFRSAYQAIQERPEEERKRLLDEDIDERAAKEYAKMLSEEDFLKRNVMLGPMQAAAGFVSIAARPLELIGSDIAEGIEGDLRVAEQGATLADRGNPWGARIRGAGSSITQAALLGGLGKAAGLTGKAATYGVIGGFGAIRGNQAITEANRAGKTGVDKWLYVGTSAAIEGGIAAAFERFGLGGFEKYFGGGKQLTRAGIKEWLKRTGADLFYENLEEAATTITEMGNKRLQGMPSEELTWENVYEAVKETAIQTSMTVGATAAYHGARAQKQLGMRDDMIRETAKGWNIDEEAARRAYDRADRVADKFDGENRNTAFNTELGKAIMDEHVKTVGGEVTWAVDNPTEALELYRTGDTSRKAFERLAGLPKMTADQRQGFVRRLRNYIGGIEADTVFEEKMADQDVARTEPPAFEMPMSPEELDAWIAERDRVDPTEKLIQSAEAMAGKSLDLEAQIKEARDAGRWNPDNTTDPSQPSAEELNQELIDLNRAYRTRFSGLETQAELATPAPPDTFRPAQIQEAEALTPTAEAPVETAPAEVYTRKRLNNKTRSQLAEIAIDMGAGGEQAASLNRKGLINVILQKQEADAAPVTELKEEEKIRPEDRGLEAKYAAMSYAELQQAMVNKEVPLEQRVAGIKRLTELHAPIKAAQEAEKQKAQEADWKADREKFLSGFKKQWESGVRDVAQLTKGFKRADFGIQADDALDAGIINKQQHAAIKEAGKLYESRLKERRGKAADVNKQRGVEFAKANSEIIEGIAARKRDAFGNEELQQQIRDRAKQNIAAGRYKLAMVKSAKQRERLAQRAVADALAEIKAEQQAQPAAEAQPAESAADTEAQFADAGIADPQLWRLPTKTEQQYPSAKTSINQTKLPAGITYGVKQGVWSKGMTNLDIGGGRYNNTSKKIQEQGATNFTYDPWNRTVEENIDAAKAAEKGVDTVTIHNTLNVIKEDAMLDRILRQAEAALKPGGQVFISVHEGDGSGVGKATQGGESWQRNQKAAAYRNLIKRHFKNLVARKHNGKTIYIGTKAAAQAETQVETPAAAVQVEAQTQLFKPQVSEVRVTGGALKTAFPGATVERNEAGDGWSITLPNGQKLDAVLREGIVPSVEEVMRDYGLSREEAEARVQIGARGAALGQGMTFRFADGTEITAERVSLLFDPGMADDSTLKHEALHAARMLGLFDTAEGQKLWAALKTEYGGETDEETEERIAAARETWQGPQGLLGRIKQFFSRLMSKLGFDWDPEAAMRETFTERFWSQDSATNPHTITDPKAMFSIQPISRPGTKPYQEWYDSLNSEAKKTLDFFGSVLNVGAKGAKNPLVDFVHAEAWNKRVKSSKRVARIAREVAALVPSDQLKRMRMNKDGTLNVTDFDREFKVKTSIMQRVVDSMPDVEIPATMVLPTGQVVDLKGKDGKLYVNGGEAYRRALLTARREQFLQGKLSQVSIGSMSKDKWGAMGFLAKNDKTIGSGDFTTICPQMFYNKGCMYCYRRASLESGVNVKLAAERVWYTGEILRIKDEDIDSFNEIGGLRIQSFGDWMGQRDHAQFTDMIIDAEARGLQVKIITKEPKMVEFVAHLKKQGLANSVFFNLSTDSLVEEAGKPGESEQWSALNPDRPFKRTKEGVPVWKRALSIGEANRYKKKYPWVNIRTVATSAAEFAEHLKDPRVDVVTGYHGHIKQPSIHMARSENASSPIEFEAVGDAGMPGFRAGKILNKTIAGKNLSKRHQKLANEIKKADAEEEYASKACCITGKCATCKTKCGVPDSYKANLNGEIRFPVKEQYEDISTGERTEVKYQLADPDQITSIKNDIVNDLRAQRGAPELEGVPAESQEMWLDEAQTTLEMDSEAGSRLVKQLSKAPRVLSDRETALMQIYYRDVSNKFTDLAEALFAAQKGGDAAEIAIAKSNVDEQLATLSAIEEAARSAGREWGRAGVARQIELGKDFSLEGVVRKLRVANGGKELTTEEYAEAKKTADTVQRLERRLSEESAKIDAKEGDTQYDQHVAGVISEVKRQQTGKRRPRQERTPLPESVEITDQRQVTNIAREIERALVEDGMRDREQIIDGVHSALKDLIPGITRRQTMDALSGYGQFSPLSKDAVDQVIRDLHGQMQQLAKLKDMEEGRAPQKTGRERRTPSPEERRLIKQVNAAKKRGGFDSTDPETQLKTALDAAKTAVRNSIADLSYAIHFKERMPGRSEVEADAELRAMRAERSELMKQYKAMFPPAKATKEQRIAAAERALDRAIAELEKRIAEGDLMPRAKAEALTSPAIEAKRARLNALRAQRDALRADDMAERNYKASLLAKIADYKDRIAEKDFAPRKREPRILTPEQLKIKRRLEDTKSEFYRKAAEYHRAQFGPVQHALDYLQETMHLSRALMTSFDLSAMLRQGGLVAYGHPRLAMQAAKAMLKAFVSRQAEFNASEEIKNDPLGQFAETAGLSITSDDGRITREEEAFMGRWAKKVPGVAASGRAYTTFLNNMRFQLFKQMYENLGRGGAVTADEAKVIAQYINAATGRAHFLSGKLNSTAAKLNSVLFAPRYVVSRFQYLAMMPVVGVKALGGSRVHKAIAMEYARTLTGAATFIGSLMAFGFIAAGDDEEEWPTISFDPRSSDFLKVKIGETRIDPMAGLQQAMVLSSRLATGEILTLGGEIRKLGTEYKEDGTIKAKGPYDKTYADVVGSFLRTKLAPIPGATWTILDDMKDVVGKKHDFSLGIGDILSGRSMFGQIFFPLSFRDIWETMEQRGIGTGTALSALAILGAGIGTYGERTEYLDAKPEERTKILKRWMDDAKWDSPLPDYSDQLDADDLAKIDMARRLDAGKHLYQLSSSDPEKRAEAAEALKGYPETSAIDDFNAYWFKPDKSGKKRRYGDPYWKHRRDIKKALNLP